MTVRSWAEVDESVIMDDVEVGRHCKIKKAIIDKHNVIPPYTEIGINPLATAKVCGNPAGNSRSAEGIFQTVRILLTCHSSLSCTAHFCFRSDC